ncbi:sigma factor [Candidatus Solirubrobacter pratensis]|uniref:sigma factor n=1 Tax=Candidatus Solirubrobacter pratensis TaxID=1298857 RepID=UPI0004297783|nr:sigma factor [Candidatus Solirubrobacter pratensis]
MAAVGLVPDAAARLPRALSRYTSGATPFAAWLLRVARNAALEHRARRRRRRELTDQGRAPAPLAA